MSELCSVVQTTTRVSKTTLRNNSISVDTNPLPTEAELGPRVAPRHSTEEAYMAVARLLTEEESDALRQFDTSMAANAVETFNVRLRNLGFTDDIQCTFPQAPPMVGYAATARLRKRYRRWHLAHPPELYEQLMNSSCELHFRSRPVVSGTGATRVVLDRDLRISGTGGMEVRPGDLLHGDRHGVLTLPTKIAAETPNVATRLLCAKQTVIEFVDLVFS